MMILDAVFHNTNCSQAKEAPRQPEACETTDHCISRCAAYGRVCPCSARAAGRAAQKKMDSILEDSEVFDGQPLFNAVDGSNILMGDKMGEGGFSCVNSCSLKDAPLDESCAIKYLKRKVMVDKRSFEHGASDLANEAFFLAKLDHPNIISLRAVTAGSVESNVSSGKDAGFFIVIDRLVETLDQRIERWQRQVVEQTMSHGLFYRLSREYKESQKNFLKEKLEVALKIASVLEYLHSMNVVFRDLKPDNVGFDKNGTLKLFDFGLAKELKPSAACDCENYKMTGHTGSRRYMAPEVAKDHPYNESVDAYSFGILLWEICSLEKPFFGLSSRKHMREVVLGGERPKMDHVHIANWPVELQGLMQSCWCDTPSSRPSLKVVKQTVEKILVDLSQPKSERVLWVQLFPFVLTRG